MSLEMLNIDKSRASVDLKDYSPGDVIAQENYSLVTLIDFPSDEFILESVDSLVARVNVTALKEERMMPVIIYDSGEVRKVFINIDSITMIETGEEDLEIESVQE